MFFLARALPSTYTRFSPCEVLESFVHDGVAMEQHLWIRDGPSRGSSSARFLDAGRYQRDDDHDHDHVPDLDLIEFLLYDDALEKVLRTSVWTY